MEIKSLIDYAIGSGSEVDPKIEDVNISSVSDKPSVIFVPAFASGSEGATVTAYADYGSGDGQYATLKNYDFMNQKVLWVKVVSQDGKTTMYYCIGVHW